MSQHSIEQNIYVDYHHDKSRNSILISISFLFCLMKFVNLGLWGHHYLYNYEDVFQTEQMLNPFSGIYTAIWLLLSAASFSLNWGLIYRSLLKKPLIFSFFIYIIFHSAIFSSNKFSSIQLSMYYIIIYFNVYLYIYKFNAEDLIGKITLFCLFFSLFNFISFFAPEYSIMRGSHQGLFRGFSAHKNDLGYFAFFFMTSALFSSKSSRSLRLFVIFSSSILVFLSFSGQAIILSISSFTFFMYSKFSRLFHREQKQALTFSLILISLSIIVYITSSNIAFDALGKDVTLTGRDKIWEFFVLDILNNNFLGYGAQSFNDVLDLRTQMYSFGIWWPIATAHSSYIEAYVRYGYVGGTLFLIIVSGAIIRSLISLNSNKSSNLFASILLILSAIGGITASEKLFLPDFGWLTFVIGMMIINKDRSSHVHMFGGKNGELHRRNPCF
ncbi:O-antigen ligase [Pannonibacter indicus]|uniref:O-antigen ligase n=2 Tax=Pannonibacter indicus TaxID=466044 RepID=A0A0K6HV11_9HYPH|nr:O-antigen ligase [Pannonibacter indicus]